MITKKTNKEKTVKKSNLNGLKDTKKRQKHF